MAEESGPLPVVNWLKGADTDDPISKDTSVPSVAPFIWVSGQIAQVVVPGTRLRQFVWATGENFIHTVLCIGAFQVLRCPIYPP